MKLRGWRIPRQFYGRGAGLGAGQYRALSRQSAFRAAGASPGTGLQIDVGGNFCCCSLCDIADRDLDLGPAHQSIVSFDSVAIVQVCLND